MKDYIVRLNGSGGVTKVTVKAPNEYKARDIAEAQYPGYRALGATKA
jgi:hypothetical protein